MSELSAGERREESLWLGTSPRTAYEPLDGGIEVDVAVVGGGITGLSTAITLQDRGKTVALVEAERIGEGVTGHSTAKITSQHGLFYDSLQTRVGKAKSQQYADANEAAIDEIERLVEEHGIDCDFERTPAYTYTRSSSEGSKIRAEVETARDLGLPAHVVESTPLPFDVEAAVTFDEQGEFHPRSYLLGIAAAFVDNGGRIYEETKARDIQTSEPLAVDTNRGQLMADDIVVATHFPFFDRGGYFSRMHPKRAYLLAVTVEGEIPEGMYVSNSTPEMTLRNNARTEDGEELLLIGGQSHKQGTNAPPPSERYRRCEKFARRHFDVEEIAYRWSTMDYTPLDKIPFIGQIDPVSSHVYIGAGFKGWGISSGTAAGLILSDLIVDGESPWEAVFDPQRLKLKASAPTFIKENAHVGKKFVGDWLGSMLSNDAIPKRRDSATVTRRNGKPVGIYRDEEGEVHAVSAICPHMRCVVEWNDAERTWDCPCHGSQFDCDGDVLHGPAVEGLSEKNLD